MDVQNKILGEQNDLFENLIAFCFSMSIFEKPVFEKSLNPL